MTLNVLAGGPLPADVDVSCGDYHIVHVLQTIAPTAAANDATVLVETSNPVDFPDRYLQRVDYAAAILSQVNHRRARPISTSTTSN